MREWGWGFFGVFRGLNEVLEEIKIWSVGTGEREREERLEFCVIETWLDISTRLIYPIIC